MTKRLTTKQQRFVDFYDGNGYKAARKADYNGSYDVLAHIAEDNLKKVHIAEAITNREKERNNPHIASREERQRLWSRIARGEELQRVVIGVGNDRKIVEIPPKMTDRLRASELLGRSEGDFLERRREEGELTVVIRKFTDGPVSPQKIGGSDGPCPALSIS